MKKTPALLPHLSHNAFLIDSHCHLDMDAYSDDLPAVLEEARTHHIKTILSIGIDESSSRAAIELARAHVMIKATIGIHPHDVNHIHPHTLNILARLTEENRSLVVGYGEIGLDYVKSQTSPSDQRQHFRSQLELAKDLKLPVIIHDRDAHDDTLRILQEAAPFDQGGVMHCFSGDMTLARRMIDLNFLISIPGVVTFKNAFELQDIARKIPLSAMLLETDGPFLSPVPRRGKRNEPAFLLHTAQAVADLRGISLDEVARQTSANAITLFHLTDFS